MTTRVADCLVRRRASLREAMLSLDKSGIQIALVVDENDRLFGTVTDGDVRRALLGGASLDDALEEHVRRDCTTVRPLAGRAEVLDLMRARGLQEIPIVDDSGRILGLHLLQEIVGAVQRPHWAVIMAGGSGTRLRPLTEKLPKPMISVAGRPILERLVLHLVGYGIRRIFLAVHYLGHTIEAHFGNGSSFGCRIEYLRENEPRGSGGALSLLPEEAAHPLIVMNGDLVTQADLGAMLEFHDRGGFKATLGVRQYSHHVPYGCVEAKDGHVTSFEEKPFVHRLVNGGIYVLGHDLPRRVPSQGEYDMPWLIADCLARGEAVGAFLIEDDWIDVGRREQLEAAREGSSS